MPRAMLFASTEIPRAPRRKLMHVTDAGNGPNGSVIEFHCIHCGHSTGWMADTKSVSENKRGRTCPKCNAVHLHQTTGE